HRSAGAGVDAVRRSALEPLPDHQAEARDQLGNALELEVMAVALAQRGQLRRVGIQRAAHVRELPEELLEARRRDDLQDPAGLVPGVPEGVPLVPRLEGQVANPGRHDLVPEQRAHLALEHVAVLVLAGVQVQRCGERARRHRMLDQGEALIGLGPVDHEADADAAEKAGLPVIRADDLWRRTLSHCLRHCCLHVSFSFFVGHYCCVEPIHTSARCVKIHRTDMSDKKRPYRKKRRAELEEETRRRITESAVELHGTVGPARTSMSAVAEHAGVRRSTLYRHFPDEASLFEACSAHWNAANPPPDMSAWAAIQDPDERLRTALEELYAYFRRTEAMMSNLIRDEAVNRSVRRHFRKFHDYLTAARDVLMQGRRARGSSRDRVRAAIGHALAFTTWRSLVREQGLGNSQAVELMLGLVASAA